MVTVFVYNSDIQGALRNLKKEQQREGTFRYVKAAKFFKPKRQVEKERMQEIVRRKRKDLSEKMLKLQVETIPSKISPFILTSGDFKIKIFDNGLVKIFDLKTDKKRLETSVDKVDFDNLEGLVDGL